MSLQQALDLAARGFRVFPLAAGSKVPPAGLSWQSVASSDPFAVELAFLGHSGNVGIATGSGIVAIDVDAHKGGDATIDGFDLPPTLVVRTPRGGRHFIFRTGESFANGVEVLGPGVDVRGEGGYVVAPGSEWSGKRYEIVSDMPLAPLPEAIAGRLSAARTRAVAPGAIVGELDTPEAIERARAYLRGAPPASEGSRNATAYRHAARVYDLGISPDMCFELVSEWNDENDPPLDYDELRRTTDSAATSRQNAIGSDNPTAGFEDFEEHDDFDEFFDRIDCSEEALKALPPREWIAGRRLLRGHVTELVAPGGVGKSLLTLQWAAALATGSGDWTSLDVTQRDKAAPVTYRTGVFNNEDDFREVTSRLGAVAEQFKVDRKAIYDRVFRYKMERGFRVAVRNKDRGLSQTRAVDDVIRWAKKRRLDVLIFDPLVEMHEAAESDNGEMSRVMLAFKRIAKEANCAVLIVHHTRKPPAAASDGYAGDADVGRGGSAVVNAARIVLTLFGMGKADGERYGIAEHVRHKYVRLDDAKANLYLKDPNPTWFERVSVKLPNGESMPALVPEKLTDRSAAQAATLLSVLVSVLPEGDAMSVSAAAAAVKRNEMFSDVSASAIARRICDAIPLGEVEAAGRTVQFDRSGDAGGKLRLRPANG